MVLKNDVLRVLGNQKFFFQKMHLKMPHKIQISSHDNYYAKIAAEFFRGALKRMGCTVTLERQSTFVRRWTVLSSPFAHKTARTQFEKRCIRYNIKYAGIDEEGSALAKWYFLLHAPPTVQIS